jgi:methyltransferase family protein
MGATTAEPDPLLDLDRLGRFATLVTLAELAEHPETVAAYFARFTSGDDATLVIYAPTADAVWAQEVVGRALAGAGTDPETCPDVRLYLVSDDAPTRERFARRVHAVLGDGSWLPIRRPAHGVDDLSALRAQAERMWGRRNPGAGAPYSYEGAIAHIVARGWSSEHHARMGSVPEASLRRAAEVLETHRPATSPRLLHVGNFVGVSLSYLLDWARGHDGTVVSVDPNIPHRDVAHPQRAVCDLLAHFGLTERHLLVCGYSLEKNFSNDSVVFDGYDPAAAWAAESAPEFVLASLARSGQRFDAAFIDGNHDPAYLRRELQALGEMLVPGGLLVLDDVAPSWAAIRRLFEEVAGSDSPYEQVLADGRIGILRRLHA